MREAVERNHPRCGMESTADADVGRNQEWLRSAAADTGRTAVQLRLARPSGWASGARARGEKG